MGKINNIIEGFTSDLPEGEDWWEKRISICNNCEFNSANGAKLSLGCKAIKQISCPSEAKGTCNKCCCCVEQKTTVRAESCPEGFWKALEATSKEFKVTLLSEGCVNNNGSILEIDLGDIQGDNTKIELITNSISKTFLYEGVRAGCGCTTSIPEELKKGRSYKHTINIKLSTYGKQSKSLDISFVGVGETRQTLQIRFTYNRINPKTKQ